MIDRPLGSKPVKEHPDFVYELNYGFIPNTLSGDGEELDCYILGVDESINEFEGECIAIVHRLNEIDDKLILVPKGKKYTIKEIEDLIYFSEKHHKHIQHLIKFVIFFQNKADCISNRPCRTD